MPTVSVYDMQQNYDHQRIAEHEANSSVEETTGPYMVLCPH
jgi:hypothetical protein